jgi:hypothetical protein
VDSTGTAAGAYASTGCTGAFFSPGIFLISASAALINAFTSAIMLAGQARDESFGLSFVWLHPRARLSKFRPIQFTLFWSFAARSPKN